MVSFPYIPSWFQNGTYLNSLMDERFTAIKPLIKAGHIKAFGDIFRVIPQTVFGSELGFNHKKMRDIIKNPGGLTVDECYTIGEVLGVKGEVVVRLVSGRSKGIV